MKKIKSIQLKAAFLLIVFSLNTIIGFACAMGLDMGYNSNQHEEEITKTAIHVHVDARKHNHNNKAKEHHDEKVKDHHETNDKDNCCNDHFIKIIQQDKAITSSKIITTPIFFTAFIAGFYNDNSLLATGINSHLKYYFARRHHPPIPDIRIAIQSFQI